ncbi:hypothetical protein QCA50_011084 [Cerrena zonata]|uniref:Uncharacterized protein n=1 Tax=Cerrena zonata TaxID=2478898 RepID=A0AAW0FXF9_9APHY
MNGDRLEVLELDLRRFTYCQHDLEPAQALDIPFNFFHRNPFLNYTPIDHWQESSKTMEQSSHAFLQAAVCD